jgi:hypothetical protein
MCKWVGDYNGEPHFLQVNKYTMSTIPHNTDYSEFMFLFFPRVKRPLKYDMHNERWTRNKYIFTITHSILGYRK